MPRPLFRIIFILLILHAYIGWRLLPALPLSPLGVVACAALLALSAILMPVGLMVRFSAIRQSIADKLSWVGFMAMGIFSSLLVLTLLRDLFLLILPPGASVDASAGAVVIATLFITLVGFISARKVARVVDVNVPIAGLAPGLEGFRIVQISDVHVGATIKKGYVDGIVDRVNGLQADIVVITGDVVDGSVADLSHHAAPLGRLAGKHGVYVVTGNHEYYSGADQWVTEFRRLGLQVLMNEHVVLETGGAQLVLGGVTDYSAGNFDPAEASDPARAAQGAPDGVLKILLAHQPRSADAAAAAGFNLQLSGHTHGGQFWPWPLFVRFQQPFTAGLNLLRGMWVYTSRGTGYWGPPLRFGAPSEITNLRLVTARA
jgi:predicted MPP superfamily phosphohydrolase